MAAADPHRRVKTFCLPRTITKRHGKRETERKDLCWRSTLSCSLSRLITAYDTTLAPGRHEDDNRPDRRCIAASKAEWFAFDLKMKNHISAVILFPFGF